MGKCLDKGVQTVARMETMVGKYHKFRASKAYKKFSSPLLGVAPLPLMPILHSFSMYINHILFTSLLKDTFPLPEASSAGTTSDYLKIRTQLGMLQVLCALNYTRN